MGELEANLDRQRRSALRPEDRTAEEAAGTTNGSIRLGEYLRRLREGYGYTLRKVEERAMALGEAIDNSQLSRFEKGKAVPSFEKLRALARVFNVPVQNFSDVLDLEEFQPHKPLDCANFAELLMIGAERMTRGEHGRAFVSYERALEVAISMDSDPQKSAEMAAEARWRMACALKALGKLFMTERELREALQACSRLLPRTRLRTLLQLSYLYRELGDLYLASVLARECLVMAREQDDRATEVGVLNTLGNIEHDGGDAAASVGLYRQAVELVEGLDGLGEMKVTVRMNLGGALAASGQLDEGLAILESAHALAADGGYRRAAALALTRQAEALLLREDATAARRRLAESDALAARDEQCFQDILFLNTYHRWVLARREGNGTGEKIAFGRLRHLRSLLQRRFPEVDEFDRHIEKTRR